jgi:hypothetical protein
MNRIGPARQPATGTASLNQAPEDYPPEGFF